MQTGTTTKANFYNSASFGPTGQIQVVNPLFPESLLCNRKWFFRVIILGKK